MSDGFMIWSFWIMLLVALAYTLVSVAYLEEGTGSRPTQLE